MRMYTFIHLASTSQVTPKTQKFWRIVLVLGVSLIAAYATAQTTDDQEYHAELEDWRQDRLQKLNRPDGWLSLVGLFRLQQDTVSLGSLPSNDVVLPEDFPSVWARMTASEDGWQIQTSGPIIIDDQWTKQAALVSSSGSSPSILSYQRYQLVVLERGGSFFLRLRDLELPSRKPLSSIPHFVPSSQWRVPAVLDTFSRGDTIRIKNILGQDIFYTSAGKLRFELDDREYGLVAFDGPETSFVIISDETSGEDTYGGGRYLYVPKVDHIGATYIDLNKAVNPPCVFTDFATCPLPPSENHLPIRIAAGEKMINK